MEGVSRVTVLDQDCDEAHEVRELADTLFKAGGCLLVDGQLVAANGTSLSDNEATSSTAAEEESSKHSRPSKYPLRFRGSQPVSISQRNMDCLINFDYCVSYKADGARYVMLIAGPHKIYMIDRANFIYKVETLHFPSVAWVKQLEKCTDPTVQQQRAGEFLSTTGGHLCNTLLDGEMVIYSNSGTSSAPGAPLPPDAMARFLIYDVITLNDHPIGRSNFFERYACIDKQIVWPRNTAGHLGLVDFGVQSFSVRRKIFRPLNQTDEVGGSE